MQPVLKQGYWRSISIAAYGIVRFAKRIVFAPQLLCFFRLAPDDIALIPR
jgi:hypothetical protein